MGGALDLAKFACEKLKDATRCNIQTAEEVTQQDKEGKDSYTIEIIAQQMQMIALK